MLPQGEFADFTDEDISMMDDYFDGLHINVSPELYSNRLIGVHQGFSKTHEGAYPSQINRDEVISALANQYNRIANPGDPGTSPDRLVSSDKFYLMQIPIDLAVPSARVEPGNRSYSDGPIIIDRNTRGVGSGLKELGFDPSIMIIDGKHRQAEAMRNGERQYMAYVGDQIIDRVQNRILSDRNSASRRFDRLQSSIPQETAIPDPSELEKIYIGIQLPKECHQLLPFGQSITAEPPGPHITLVFIGDRKDYDSQSIQLLEEICGYVSTDTEKLRGQISGTNRFPATKHSDDKEVVYAEVHVDGLPELRKSVVDMLSLYDIPYQNHFSTYVPHVTLEYVEQGEQTPDLNFKPLFVKFDCMYLSCGEKLKNFYFK
jgi:2'-5' RNA ligase